MTKAEEFIKEKSAPDGLIIGVSDALEAIRIAKEEEREKVLKKLIEDFELIFSDKEAVSTGSVLGWLTHIQHSKLKDSE